MSYVFPAAQCDLDLSLQDKGLLNAATYIGADDGYKTQKTNQNFACRNDLQCVLLGGAGRQLG